MNHPHAGLTGAALLGTGLVLGAAGGYYLGRWRQAFRHWRSSSRKVRRDIGEIRRGPRL